LDRSDAALIALALNTSTNTSVTHVKSAIDRLVSDVSHKASLWTMRVESESECSLEENYWANKPSCEPAMKPLYLLAAECRENRSTEQITDLKLRLSEMLGKRHQKQQHAS